MTTAQKTLEQRTGLSGDELCSFLERNGEALAALAALDQHQGPVPHLGEAAMRGLQQARGSLITNHRALRHSIRAERSAQKAAGE